MNAIYICILILAAAALFLCFKTKEYYGGQIKKIRKIPFNDCARICNTYLQDCIKKYNNTDAGWCYERFGPMGTCVSECYYSNHQRM